ncbi:MAG: family 10 glycosylhydrolase [Clostridia bacterium]|nr:family 10 glycosylhydrolase [Clostridia bacterium]
MKKKGILRLLNVVFLSLLVLVTSCSGSTPYLHLTEVPGTLPYEEISPSSVGLLNPDAEVRGVWIATVGNINFPSKKGLSEKALKKELDAIVQNCEELGLNTIFFQVRPAADALYASKLFPASEYVSGVQGKSADGGFDCLEYLIDIAHGKKINVHGWVNPLRVTYGSAKYPKTDISELSAGHIARKNPDWVIPYADGKLYFDAGNPSVRAYIAEGVREIVKNYAVDGIVFDDYFYPYPVSGSEFDDSNSFSLYGGGNRDDWRRENINSLVKDCYNAVKGTRRTCLFGISPFGIWQNDDGKNGGSATSGLEAYNSLYCDALAWVKGGYVDYISPQLYWRFDTSAAPYDILSDWWNAVLDGTSVKLLISHGVYKYDEWEDPYSELKNQVEYSREALTYRGSVLYGYAVIENDIKGIRSEISELFENEIIYSDTFTNYKKLTFTGPPSGGTTNLSSIQLKGESDPTLPLTFMGKKISRDKNGSFSVALPLTAGENTFTFICGEEEVKIKIIKTEEK